jgi:hypothetical protein
MGLQVGEQPELSAREGRCRSTHLCRGEAITQDVDLVVEGPQLGAVVQHVLDLAKDDPCSPRVVEREPSVGELETEYHRGQPKGSPN